MVNLNPNIVTRDSGVSSTTGESFRGKEKLSPVLENRREDDQRLGVTSGGVGEEIFDVAQTSRQEEVGRERRDRFDRVGDFQHSERNVHDQVLLSRDAQDFLNQDHKDESSLSLAEDLAARRAGAGEARTEARSEEFVADVSARRDTIENEVDFIRASTDTEQEELQDEIAAVFGGGIVKGQESDDSQAGLREARSERSASREEEFIDSKTDSKAVEHSQVERDQAVNVAQRNVQDEINSRDAQSVRDNTPAPTSPSNASSDAGRPEPTNDAVATTTPATPPPGGDLDAPPTSSDSSERSEQASGVPTLDIVA